jgi:hypothetical protein
MRAIARAVENLSDFPLGAPLPDADGNFRDRPCSTPKRRAGYPSWNPVCMCGWNMGEHNTKGGAK